MYKDEALRIALEGLERSMEAGMMTGIKVDQAIAALRQALEQPECNPHPDAPHGFDRDSSHSLGRYVCDCEGWEQEPTTGNVLMDSYLAMQAKKRPVQQKPVAWMSDSPTKGNGKQLHWTKAEAWRWSSNIAPLYTAPPKPAQDLIVGYADVHDLTRDGHDFWVSRQPGKNTVPLYLYGHPPKIWQGLTNEEIAEAAKRFRWDDKYAFASAACWAEEKLREKNGF